MQLLCTNQFDNREHLAKRQLDAQTGMDSDKYIRIGLKIYSYTGVVVAESRQGWEALSRLGSRVVLAR